MAQRCATLAELRTQAPVFDPVPDDVAQFALDAACCMVNLECWGKKASFGSLYLAAHLLAMQTGIDAGGTVERKKIDKIEIQFSTTTPSDGDLGSTKWGQNYLAIRRTLMILPVPGRCSLPLISC